MAMNKFQRSRLTFDLSAWGPINILKHSFLTNRWPNWNQISCEDYDKLARIYAKYFGHMTKITATHIYGKNHLKIFFSRTRRPVILGLGM